MNTDVFIKNGIHFQRMDFSFFFFFRLHSSVREVHSFGLFWVSFWEEEEEEDFPGVCGKISPECVGGEDFSDILDDHHLRFSFWSFSLTTLPIFCLLYLLYTASPPASLIASLYHLDSLFFSLFSRFFSHFFWHFPLSFFTSCLFSLLVFSSGFPLPSTPRYRQ